jgi:hypothetical protein
VNGVQTRPARAVVVIAALGLACGAAVPAAGVVNTPPQFPITVLPGSEGVEAAGYTEGEPLVVEARRGPFLLSTASGAARTHPGFVGIIVNHPPDVGPTVCWKGVTPDLLPGDYIRVVRSNGDSDEMQIPDIGLTSNPTNVGGGVTLSGFAKAPLGGPLLIDGLVANILPLAPPLSNGDRLLTTDPVVGLGAAGTIAYTPPGSTNWTATWDSALFNTPFTSQDRMDVLGGEGMVTFTGDTLTEITTVGAADLAGPDGTCPGPSAFAIPVPPTLDASSDTGAPDNATTKTALLIVGPTGRAAPGTTVSLLINGQVAAAGTVTPERTYSIATPVLPDGVHEFRIREIISGFNRTSGPLTVTVDTTAPGAPSLSTSPASGSNDNAPKVTGSAEAGSTVRLYSGAGCTGTPAVTAPASQLASGITVAVADNTTATYSATAADAIGHVSACSAPVSYAEVTPPPPIPTGRVALLGNLATSSAAWQVRLRLSCTGPQGVVCFGRVNLTARVTSRTAAGRRVTRTLVIGQKSFAVRVGRPSTIVVQVRKQARSLITKRGRLSARVQIVTQIGNGATTVGTRTVTVVAPKR